MSKRGANTTKAENKVHDKPRKSMIVSDPSYAQLPVHDLIGEKLRAYYEHVASEPVPDRFATLLAQLEAKDNKKSQG
jgi:DNA-binding protein Fis